MKTSMKKRLLSLFLCVLMLVGMLPVSAMAADGEEGGAEPIEAEAYVGEAVVVPEESETPTLTEEPVSSAPAAAENETPIETEPAPIYVGEAVEEAPMLLTEGEPEPTPAPEKVGSVRVIISNDTYPVSDGAPWDGDLVDEWVEIDATSTMMSAIVTALSNHNYSQTGAETNYISEINGLEAFDGGNESGWMGTLNDWFTNYGFGEFTVAAGTLGDKDEIHLVYTCDYGVDCGGDWGNSDTTVKAVSFSAGTLDTSFDKNTHAYTLTVPAGTTGVVVTPTASNKNYQVRTFDGSVTDYANGAYYKRSETVPVSDGSVIKVVCADPSWPSMSASSGAVVYTFTVAVEPEINPVEITAKVNFSNGGAFLKDKNGADMVLREITLNTKAKYTIADILTEAHRLYHADGASAFAVEDDSSYGPYITKFWGVESTNVSYQLNAGADYVGGADTAVDSGDVLDVYLLQGIYPDDEAYTAFASYTAEAVEGEDFTVTLLQAGYDESWNLVMSPCTGATVTVDGTAAEAVTDADGKATVKLTEGTHVISAVKQKANGDTAITAPVCVVKVEAAPASVPFDPATFTFTGIRGNNQFVYPMTLVEDNGRYILRVPDPAVTQDSVNLVVEAPDGLKDEFSVTYTYYLSATTYDVDKVVTSTDGKASVSKWYYTNSRQKGVRLYNKSILLSCGEESCTIDIVPYSVVASLYITDLDNMIQYPVTQDEAGNYHATVYRGSTVAVNAEVAHYISVVYRVATMDGEENVNSSKYYCRKDIAVTDESPEEITVNIKITDQTDVPDEYREYVFEEGNWTLTLHVTDGYPYPQIQNYYTHEFDEESGVFILGYTTLTVDQFSTEGTTLTVDVKNDTGNMTYEWVDKYDYGLGQTINVLATGKSYTIDTSSAGRKTVFCRVTNVVDGVAYQNWTDEISIKVKAITVAAPKIITQPVSAEYSLGDTPAALTVSVEKTDSHTYTYQWYKGEVGSGTAVEGATSASYTPSIGTVGTESYYCAVTAVFNGVNSQTVNSEAAVITVKEIEISMDGEGTADSPYLIASAEDLQNLHDLVNLAGLSFNGIYFQMAADITLPEGWTPIGCTKDGTTNIKSGKNLNAFSGIFDGGNYTLTVPEGGLPLLGYVNGATVRNLKLYGTRINGYGLINNMEGVGMKGTAVVVENITLKAGTQTLKAGLLGGNITTNGFAGVSADFASVIRNCTAEAGVVIGYSGEESHIGTFAGRFMGTIENCVSYATVKGVDYVGGIIGTRDNAMGDCIVDNCQFHGTVEAGGKYAGGIIGGGYWGAAAPNAIRPTITGCTVDGTVSGNVAVGGITGGDPAVAQAWNLYSVTGNIFTGKVSGSQYVGAIIGYYNSLNVMDNIAGNTYSADCGADKGIAYVKYLDTNAEAPATMEDTVVFSTETSVADCPAVSGCAWKVAHNRTDDPLGADADKLCAVIKEAVPENMRLSELVFCNSTASDAYQFALTPAFDPAVPEYTLLLPDTLSALCARATLDTGATGTIKAKYKGYTGADKTMTLQSGNTSATVLPACVKVNSTAGVELQITVDGEVAYTVHVLRYPALNSLAISDEQGEAVELTPAFNNNVFEYTATVPVGAALTVAASCKSYASYTVNGTTETTVTPVWTDHEAEIVVEVTAEGGEPARYTVKLVELPTVPDPAVNLTAVTDSPVDGIPVGETAAMTVFPENSTEAVDPELLTFVSDNEAVATVDENGVITGKSVGTAGITATLIDDAAARSVTVLVTVVSTGSPACGWQITDANGDISNDSVLAMNVDNDAARTFTIALTDKDGNVLPSKDYTFTSGDAKVAKIAKAKDGSITLTVPKKANGACTVTAKPVDKNLSSATVTLSVFVMDYVPRLGSSKVTLNSYIVDGVSVSMIPSYENEIESVEIYEKVGKTDYALSTALTASYDADSDTLTLATVDGSAVKNGTITAKLMVHGSLTDCEVPVTVVVKNTLPTVTVKQTRKPNLFLTDDFGAYTITAKNAVIANAEYTIAGYDTAYADGVLTLTRNDAAAATKGSLSVRFEGYNTPYVKEGLAFATVNTKLALAATPAAATVSAKSEGSVAFTVYNKTAKCDLDLSSATVTSDKGSVVISGNSIVLTADSAMMDVEKKTAHKVTVTVTDPAWTAPLSLTYTLTVQPAPTAPVAKLKSSSLTLNTLYPSVEASTLLTLDQSNRSVTEAEFTCSKTDKISVALVGDQVVATLLDNTVAAGSYTFTGKLVSDGDAMKDVKLTVKVINTKASATVAASGKLDAIRRDSTAITYTVTLKNASGDVTSVAAAAPTSKLSSKVVDGSAKFDIELGEPNAKGQPTVKLTLKPGESYDTKLTYKLQFAFEVEGVGTVTTADVSVKVTQSAMKITNSGSAKVFQSQAKTKTVVYTLTLTAPDGARISSIEKGTNMNTLFKRSLADAGSNISWRVSADGRTAYVYVTVKDTSKLVAGKSYTIPLVITAEGCAEHGSVTKLNLTLKAAK